MAFAGTNYLAIVVATTCAFIFGAVYYGVLSKPWMRAGRVTPDNAKPLPAILAVTFLAELAMAWIMAGLIGHLGPGQVTLTNGIISAAIVWFGFMLTTMAVNHRYQGYGWDLTLIDGGHWLGVAVIMGAVIGLFGV
jgi:hypothetical protein